MRNVDGTASPLAFFGAELRRIRMEAGLSQQTTEAPSVAVKLTKTFNILRGEALSQAASRELIMKVAEESWT
jgi:hypothetical protein